MKKLILMLAVVVSPYILKGQTLHALIFVNEKEEGREVDRRADMKNMSTFFEEIAKNINYEFNLRQNSDTEFTARELDREIDNLDVRENDIVVFYYGGHGYNEGKDKWPSLNLKDRKYWQSDILKKMNQHKSKAKLMLCIAACCNKVYRNNRDIGGNFNPILTENVKALFTDFSGKKTIVISSSKQGQLSWSDTTKGSIFGQAFRKALYDVTDNSNINPTWNMLRSKTIEYTINLSDEKKQIPQFQEFVTTDFNPFEEGYK